MGVFDFLSRSRPKAVASDREDPQWAVDKALTLPGVDVVLTPSMTGMLRTSRLPRRGTIELLTAYEHMPYLQSVIRKISKSAASVPLRAFSRTSKRPKKDESPYVRDAATQGAGFVEKHTRLKALRQASELREILDSPLITLLANPGCGFRGNMLMQMTFAWIDLVGEAFWVFLTNPAGMPNAIMPIPPHWIRDLPTRSQPFFRVQIDSLTYEVPIDHMLWFRDPSLVNPYGRGAGTGMSLADELDVDENASKHVSSFFYNRAMPDMIVSVEEADENVLKTTKAKFEQDHRGMLNAHRSAFMNGKASVTRLDTTFNDMNLIELRKYSGRDVVIQSFGVSPEMLGIMDNSNRATVAEAREMFAENVLVPRLELVQTTLQEFAERFDTRLIITYDDPVPVNRDFALKVAQARPGSRTENEWRVLQDLDPVEGGDVFRVSPTDIVVDSLDAGKRDLDGEAQAAQAAAQAAAAPDGGAVQDTALNGSQVASMQAIAIAVAAGELPKASAIALLLASFPSLDEKTAHAIIDPIKEGSAPKTPPPTGPGGGKPVDEPTTAKAAPRDIGAIVKAFEDDEIENVLESLRPERLTVETYPVIVDTIKDLGSLEAAVVGAPGTFNMLNPLVTSYLADYSTTKIKDLVDGTTRDSLRATLTEGVRAGEDVRRLSKRVESVFEDADRRRSIVIARTEVVGAANRGTYAAHVMSGVVNRRQWVPTPDARSRDTHKVGSKLAGQVRAIGERFESDSGATALHPHAFGVAKEDVQCRCTTIAVMGVEPKSAADLIIEQRDFETRVEPFEERYERGIKRGFKAQQADVIAALEKAAQ